MAKPRRINRQTPTPPKLSVRQRLKNLIPLVETLRNIALSNDKKIREHIPMLGDYLILRQVLLEKGIITHDDLKRKEAELRKHDGDSENPEESGVQSEAAGSDASDLGHEGCKLLLDESGRNIDRGEEGKESEEISDDDTDSPETDCIS
jgi:hypothetical protein